MYLSAKTLTAVNPAVTIPAYDREAVSIGIVHFGPGAFHRGHQAYFVDALLARDPRWGLCEVELRPGGSSTALVDQDCLYTIAELEVHPEFRIVGAIKEYLSVAEGLEPVFARLTDPAIKLVTLTVTEKGYGLGPDGRLDMQHPDIVHDLAEPWAPRSVVGWIVESLRRRRAAGEAPFIVMSCDNIERNGKQTRQAVLDFAAARTVPGLADWIAVEVRFPSTMTDGITPATTEDARRKVAAGLGLTDEAPVQCERFRQWVIEDILGPDGPDFGSVGADMTSDVEAYEQAKLRFVNGLHSTLAYVGLQRGANSVEAAISDPEFASFLERMAREDIAPAVRPAKGFDHSAYIAKILERFANPALTHLLTQIAADGTQKLPYRILGTIADNLAAGRNVGRLAVPVAAWMRFVEREAKAGRPLNDPLAEELAALGRACTGRAADDVPQFLALTTMFPPALSADPHFTEAITAMYDRFAAGIVLPQ